MVMALFISKPIMWNTNGYRKPSGVKVNAKAFPGEHGFGHEEWNGSSGLAFEDEGVAYRAFHTERVGYAPVYDEAGRTFVFMYASHDGIQELVGVAGNATCLIDDEPQRKKLASRLRLDELGEQAWAIPRVQKLHGDDRSQFDKIWRADLPWIPTWKCTADMFLWLEKPAPLDSHAIRGTVKLLTMFGTHTDISRDEALRMLDAVPTKSRTAPWRRIRSEIDGGVDTLPQDLVDIGGREDIKNTTRQQLIEARLGQGKFRRAVELLWDKSCSVSGCSVREVLRASHIKAWKPSTDRERLDGDNGLLLTADLDALFDRGLISFNDDGDMLVSARLTKFDRKLFQLPRKLRKNPTKTQSRYLADHRRRWALDQP
jgi:hypothetical protein